MKIARSFLAAAAVSMATLLAAGAARAQAPVPPTAPPTEAPKEQPAGEPLQPTRPDAQPQTKPADQPGSTPTTDKPAAEEKLVYVKMTTSKGDIILELNNEKAPISTQNFLAYTDKGFYNGTIFHRVIDGFMIQGGGFTPDMTQKPTDKPIKNEWQNGLKNTRGTIAMARLGDRKPNESTVNSATAQFFINVKDNAFLDSPQPDGGAYAVFGRVIAGMDVVDKIKSVKTGVKTAPTGQGFSDVPQEPVVIESVQRITAEDAQSAAAKQ